MFTASQLSQAHASDSSDLLQPSSCHLQESVPCFLWMFKPYNVTVLKVFNGTDLL